jgi:aminopeptidase N
LTADLTVMVGDGWQGVTTGEATAIERGFRITNTDPRLDITFSLSKSFHITQANGFTIYDQREQHEGTDRLVSTATQCQSFLNNRFGSKYPLPVGKLLITERSSSGYARENYIAFTDISETKPGPLMRFVCHEFAHYWSSGAKFDTVDNWINEAFAEYLGMMAVREQLGQAGYDNLLLGLAEKIADKDLPHIWKQGDTARSSYEVQYQKAPLKLAELEKNIGAESFLKFVQSYFVSDNKSTEGLLNVLETTAGSEQRIAFEAALAE